MLFTRLPVLLALWGSALPAGAQVGYEACYRFLGDDPSEREAAWAEDAQGITHDDGHWFLTQTMTVWKVPVSQDLGTVTASSPGVVKRHVIDYPELVAVSATHFGDPTYYEHSPTERYVIVPIGTDTTGFAFFHADDLALAAFLLAAPTGHLPWAAVDPQGRLYAPREYHPVEDIGRYLVDWPSIKNGPGASPLVIEGFIPLAGPDGATPWIIHHTQGGTFTPSGELLYIVADGILVFETQTWTQIAASSNSSSALFSYQFDDGWGFWEEPEGLTFWDLDDAEVPGLGGQLHAVMLDNDALEEDDVSVKHYTYRTWVDASIGSGGSGTKWAPYASFADAAAEAWSGSEIRLAPGIYPDTATITERVLLTSTGGDVLLGTDAP